MQFLLLWVQEDSSGWSAFARKSSACQAGLASACLAECMPAPPLHFSCVLCFAPPTRSYIEYWLWQNSLWWLKILNFERGYIIVCWIHSFVPIQHAPPLHNHPATYPPIPAHWPTHEGSTPAGLHDCTTTSTNCCWVATQTAVQLKLYNLLLGLTLLACPPHSPLHSRVAKCQRFCKNIW